MTLSFVSEVRDSIRSAIARADHEEVRRAFAACTNALARCRTSEDVLYVRDVFQEAKRGTILYGVAERMARRANGDHR